MHSISLINLIVDIRWFEPFPWLQIHMHITGANLEVVVKFILKNIFTNRRLKSSNEVDPLITIFTAGRS